MSDALVIGLLVTAAVCGVIGALLLRDSGRQGIGAALGLLLGPVGIIVAAILRSDRSHAVPVASGLKKCPECAELIQPDARRCRYCGADVSAVPAPTPVLVAVEPATRGRSGLLVFVLVAAGALLLLAGIAYFAGRSAQAPSAPTGQLP